MSPNCITNGAIIDPNRAEPEQNPIAAFLTTVGNNSEQYKYTIMKTINAVKLPTTVGTPSGRIANK